MSQKKTSESLQNRATLRNLALFSQDDSDITTATIPLNKIVVSKHQPRRYFDPQAMESLIESIKENGVLQPILVRPLNNKYEIVAGERRYRAALEIGLNDIPAISKEMTDIEASQYALTENLQREDLNPVEETESILQLLALKCNIDTEEVISLLNQRANAKRGFTDNVVRNDQIKIIDAVFQSIGRLSTESFRTHRLPLLKLPSDILEALRQGQIEYTKAKAIAKVKEETQRQELLKDTIENRLSLSQIKEKIAALKTPSDDSSPKNQLQNLTRRLNQSKLWEKDKKTWKKVEGLLQKINSLLTDVEIENKNIDAQNVQKSEFIPLSDEEIKAQEEYLETFYEKLEMQRKEGNNDEIKN